MKKVLLAVATTMGLTLVLVACNNGGGGGSSPVTTPQACSSYNNNNQYPYNGQNGFNGQNGQVANTCGTSGYVQTAQGCLPMWQGNPNYGNYNGTQVPVTCGFNYGPGNVNGFGPNNGWGQQYPYNNGFYNQQYYYYYYGNPQPVPLVPGFMGNAGYSAGIWFGLGGHDRD